MAEQNEGEDIRNVLKGAKNTSKVMRTVFLNFLLMLLFLFQFKFSIHLKFILTNV